MKENDQNRDLNTMIKTSGFAGVGKLADICFRYGTSVVLTRILGAETFGIFILGRTLVLVISMISNLGMGYGAVRQIAFYAAQKDEHNVQQSIRIALIVPGIVSIITALLLFFWGDYLAQGFFKKPALSLPLKILVFSIPVITIAQVLLEILRGFKKITSRVVVEYYLMPFTNLALIFVFYFLGFKLEGAIIAFVLSNFVALVILIFLNRRCMLRELSSSTETIISPNEIETGDNGVDPGKPHHIKSFAGVQGALFQKHPLAFIRKEAVLSLFKFSLPLTFVSIFNEIKLRLDILLLGWLSTAANTSIFFIALRLASFLALPNQASHMIFAPMVSGYYARGEIDKISYNYKNITKIILIGGMFLMGFIVIFSRELLSLFGAEFEKGVPVLLLVCLGQLVKTLAGNAGVILVMVGRPTLNLVVMIVTVVLLAALNIVLIPPFGIVGAGIANLTVVTVTSLMELTFVYRYVRIHPFRMDFLKCFSAGLAGGGIVFLLKIFVLPPHLFSTLLLMAAFGLLYFIFLVAQKLTAEEKILLDKIKNKVVGIWAKNH